MTKAHAPIAPSGAAQLVQCPGSLRMQAKYPEGEQDEAAAEGEAAHWVLEQMMAGHVPAEGSPTPNARVVTDAMLDGADVAIEQVLADLQPFGMGLEDVAVEQPVNIPRVHADCWGTPDLRAWVPGNKHPQGIPTLYVWDYKFGHRHVDVFENLQLVAYAVGALEATRLQDSQAQCVLGIIQPRAFHKDGPCRWWKVKMDQLRALVNIYSNAAHEALGDNPRVQTGPGCRDCRARHACPTLQTAGYSLVEMAGRAQVLEMPAEAMGLELATITDAIARLTARQTGLQEQVEATIRAGKRVPGWRVEHGLGRTTWKRPAAEVIQLGAVMGLNLAKPPAAVTPRQAKLAGLPETIVAAYSEALTGAATLTRDTGDRARKVFSSAY